MISQRGELPLHLLHDHERHNRLHYLRRENNAPISSIGPLQSSSRVRHPTPLTPISAGKGTKCLRCPAGRWVEPYRRTSESFSAERCLRATSGSRGIGRARRGRRTGAPPRASRKTRTSTDREAVEVRMAICMQGRKIQGQRTDFRLMMPFRPSSISRLTQCLS